MKRLLIVAAVLLVPAVAFATDWKWSNYYEGVAGGRLDVLSIDNIKSVAVGRAVNLSTVVDGGACSQDPYSHTAIPGMEIGRIAPPAVCQCADGVCICTAKLEVVCLSKDTK